MVNDAKKMFLAGIGAAALGYEKGIEVVKQLVEKGKFSVEEGKELAEELKRNIGEKGTEAKENVANKIQEIKPLTKEDLKEVLEDMNYATKAELVELKRKIEVLENKINEMKTL